MDFKRAAFTIVCFVCVISDLHAEEASRHFENGIKAFNANQLETAIEEFKHAIAEDPTYADAYYHLGLSYYRKAKFDEAIASLNRAIELIPGDPEAYIKLGMAYYKKGNLDEAINSYKRGLEIEPNSVEAYNNLGMAYDEAGRFEAAIAAYKAALSINPNLPQLHKNLKIAEELKAGKYSLIAYRHYRRGLDFLNGADLDTAIKEFSQAVKESPAYVDAYHSLGEAYFEKGMYDAAIASYNKLIKLEPNRIDTLYHIGNAYFQKGQFDQAVIHYQRVIKLEPKYVYAYGNLGLAYQEMGKFDDAIAAYNTALKLDSNLLAIKIHLEIAEELKSGQYTLQAYRLWNLARQFSQAGKNDTAVEILKQVLAANPNYAEVYNTLAWLYADKLQAHLEEAEALAKKAMELKPNKAHIYDTLGWVLYKMGKYNEAIHSFEKAISLQNNNAEFFYHASLTYLQNRQLTESLARLKSSVMIDKKYLELAKQEKVFEPLHNNSEFQALLADMVKK